MDETTTPLEDEIIEDPLGDPVDSAELSLTSNPVDEIMAYILETPENTNPNVLRGILEKYFNQNNKEDLDDDEPITNGDDNTK